VDQGIGTLGSLVVLGVEFTQSRGVSPSSGLVKLLPAAAFDRFVDDMYLTYGGVTLTATDMAVADVSQRNFDGRDGFRWDAVIQDRRWKWRYPRIGGTYNRRLCDGSVDEKGKKNARELGEMLAVALGESGFDVSNLPTDVYPAIRWDDAIVRFELAWLGELFGLVVCPKLNNTFALEPIMQSASLPAGGVSITPPAFAFKPAIMPSSLKVQGSHDRKQGWLNLQPLGLDVDGTIAPLASCSWASGLSAQWTHAFPDVAQDKRHLAFQTAYRWYGPAEAGIILTGHTLETGLDTIAGVRRCLPPQVRGQFNLLDDFCTTSPSEAIYNGDFTVREDLNLVEFPYPMTRVNGDVSPAILQINTGYIEVDNDGNPTSAYSKTKAVPEARKTTEPRVLRHAELSKREIVDAFYGTAGDNTSELDAEAQIYLDAVASGYSYAQSQDVLYNGILALGLSGGVSQITWKVGNGRVATTRVGVNHEFDITAMHYQQRRAQERLSQMAERASL